MELSKDIFSQYADIENEICLLERQLEEIEKQIQKLIEDGCVKDKVYGGDGGIQGYCIEGFPIREYNRRRKLLRKKHDMIKKRENDLLELQLEVETQIDKIPVSRDRQILKLFFFDGLSQQKIGDKFHLDQSVVSRIIKKYVEN